MLLFVPSPVGWMGISIFGWSLRLEYSIGFFEYIEALSSISIVFPQISHLYIEEWVWPIEGCVNRVMLAGLEKSKKTQECLVVSQQGRPLDKVYTTVEHPPLTYSEPQPN